MMRYKLLNVVGCLFLAPELDVPLLQDGCQLDTSAGVSFHTFGRDPLIQMIRIRFGFETYQSTVCQLRICFPSEVFASIVDWS